MKKKIRQSILFSLISLSLVSCGRTSASTPSNSTAGNSQQTSDKTSLTDSNKHSGTSTTGSTTSGTTSTSGSTGSTSSPSTPDEPDEPSEDEDLWGEDISAQMKEHLGGEVLPYVNLGRGADASWKRNLDDYGILTITGNKFKKEMLDECNTTYTARGWKCTVTATTVTATLDEKHLSIKLTGDDLGYAVITAVFDEPFDKTSCSAWDATTLSNMHKYLGGHELPFIYLGMLAPDTTFDNKTKTFGIDGGKWDDSVLDDSMAALQAGGYQNVKKTTESYGVVVSGNYTFEDGCYVSIEIYKSGSTSAPFPHLSCYYKEKYEAPTSGQWPSDIASRFTSSFDGHELPYLYLGTNTLSYDWNNEVKKLTIDGGFKDDRIFSSAKTVLETAGYTCIEEKNSDGSLKSLITNKKMDDGCTIVAVLFATSLVSLDIYYYNPLSVPADSTAFDEAITEKINKYVDGHSADIPYVYLGTDRLDTDYDTYDEALTITGDVFNGAMIDNAKASYEAAGYNVTISSDDSFGRTFVATKTMSDNCVITAKMNSGYGNKSAALTLSFVEGFNIPGETDTWAMWSDTIKDAMKLELGGHELPYFYLGTKNPTLKQSSKTVELTGKSWDSRILDLCKTALNGMSDITWTFTDSSDRIDGVGKDEDGNTITIALYKNAKERAYFKATYLKNFVVPTDGAWDDDTKSLMTTNFGEILPYVYLATSDVDSSYYNGELTITGEAWDDQIADLAKTALTDAGYSFSSGTSVTDNGSEMITAYKQTANNLIRIAIYKDRNDSAVYEAFLSTPVTYPSDATAWSDSIQTQMTDYMGNHAIPFFYTGAKTPSVTLKTYRQIGKKYLQLSSFSDWNENYALNAKQVLETAGWNVTYFAVQDDSYDGSRIEASYKYSDGSTVNLNMKAGYSSPIFCIAYQDAFVVDESKTDWSPAAVNAMESNLNGYKLPYFYLGTDTPSVSVDTTYHTITMVGDIWDEQIFTLAENALKSDETFNWSVIYDYSNSSNDSTTGKTLVAAAEDTIHNKHFTLKVYGFGSGKSNAYGVVAPVVELSYN